MLSNKPSPHTFFQLPFPTLQTRRRRISLSPFLSMDSSQGCFLLDVKTMESSRPPERKTVRPNTDQAFNCPRCSSTNTKFCYYNNYSLSQPRYFCKTCRRYWTEGGSFRNVPVGGSSRKNKRTSSSSSAGSKIKVPVEELHQQNQTQNPRIIHQGCQDLNLAFPSPSDNDLDENPKSPSMGLSLGSFMPPLPILETSASYSARFPLVEFRPSLGFPTSDAFENAYGSLQCLEESTGAKIFFPVDDLKQVAASSGSSDHHQFDHNRQKVDPNGYWNGVLGGGSW